MAKGPAPGVSVFRKPHPPGGPWPVTGPRGLRPHPGPGASGRRAVRIPPAVTSALPASILLELRKIAPEKQPVFLEAYGRQAKSWEVALLCWLLVGGHYAYLGRVGRQVLFWLTGGGLLVWWLVDGLRLRRLVREHNCAVARAVLRSLARA